METSDRMHDMIQMQAKVLCLTFLRYYLSSELKVCCDRYFICIFLRGMFILLFSVAAWSLEMAPR